MLSQLSKFPFLESHMTWLCKHPTSWYFRFLVNHMTCLYNPSKFPFLEILSQTISCGHLHMPSKFPFLVFPYMVSHMICLYNLSKFPFLVIPYIASHMIISTDPVTHTLGPCLIGNSWWAQCTGPMLSQHPLRKVWAPLEHPTYLEKINLTFLSISPAFIKISIRTTASPATWHKFMAGWQRSYWAGHWPHLALPASRGTISWKTQVGHPKPLHIASHISDLTPAIQSHHGVPWGNQCINGWISMDGSLTWGDDLSYVGSSPSVTSAWLQSDHMRTNKTPDQLPLYGMHNTHSPSPAASTFFQGSDQPLSMRSPPLTPTQEPGHSNCNASMTACLSPSLAQAHETPGPHSYGNPGPRLAYRTPSSHPTHRTPGPCPGCGTTGSCPVVEHQEQWNILFCRFFQPFHKKRWKKVKSVNL